MFRVVISVLTGGLMAIFSLFWGMEEKGTSPDNALNTGTSRIAAGPYLEILPPTEADAVATLRFRVKQFSYTELYILSREGVPVRALVRKYLPSGRYQISWYGESDAAQKLAPGIYRALLRTEAGEFTAKVVYP